MANKKNNEQAWSRRDLARRVAYEAEYCCVRCKKRENKRGHVVQQTSRIGQRKAFRQARGWKEES